MTADTFGHWLKLRRKALDLTQHELAGRVGCSPVTIQRIETDLRRPSRQIAERLAQCLEIADAERPNFVRFARMTARAEPATLIVHQPTRPAHQPALHHGMPVPLTPLIGREAEVAAVHACLLRTPVRLLTLVGPPGIGKTRLALQAAAGLGDVFESGVAFVALAPIRDAGLAAAAIARALGIAEAGGRSLPERIKAYLRDRQLLLLLDNFEQVPAATLVADLLAAAPQLKVLATSRAALHLSGEHEYPVPPLAFPPAPTRSDPGPAWEALAEYPAVELFAQRARAIRPGFALDGENAPAVAELCRRLEGLPLAIELAAARSKLFTPSALLARLDHRLALLTGGPCDLPPRQQTLRDAIDWSYDLLGAEERRLFARLAVCAGGCTLAAAETICGDWRLEIRDWRLECSDQSPISNLQSLTGLGALVDKSLLQQTDSADGEPRFAMLETIREYALERLEQRGEAATLRQRHARYYLDLAEAAAPYLMSGVRSAWLEQLDWEHDNLRAALAWSQIHDREIALRLAGALGWYWFFRGHLSEGRAWLEAALATTPSTLRLRSGQASLRAGDHRPPTTDQPIEDGGGRREDGDLPSSILQASARALQVAGVLAWYQGDYAAAPARLEASLGLFRTLGVRQGSAYALSYLGYMGYYLARDPGAYTRARAQLEESAALFRALDDRWGLAFALCTLGNLIGAQDEIAAARTLLEESLALFRSLADPWGLALALDNLGIIAAQQEDYTTAYTLFAETLALRRAGGDRPLLAQSLYNLGNAAREQGDYPAARMLLEESAAHFSELGEQAKRARSLHGLGNVLLLQADLAGARACYAESQALYEGLGDAPGIATGLLGLAGLAHAEGHPERAARLFSAAHARFEALGTAANLLLRGHHERQLAAVRARLGEGAFAAAWEAGRMAQAQALREAKDRVSAK